VNTCDLKGEGVRAKSKSPISVDSRISHSKFSKLPKRTRKLKKEEVLSKDF
jgi:hypothetical protein